VIGFAGARVIEATIRETLPEGFQRSEYLLDHGMVDMVVPRTELKDTLGRVLSMLTHGSEGSSVIPLPQDKAPAQASASAGRTVDDADFVVIEDSADKIKPAE
jgi:acetyl-CoA carboxylase carboxyl transferase subunit beta